MRFLHITAHPERSEYLLAGALRWNANLLDKISLNTCKYNSAAAHEFTITQALHAILVYVCQIPL